MKKKSQKKFCRLLCRDENVKQVISNLFIIPEEGSIAKASVSQPFHPLRIPKKMDVESCRKKKMSMRKSSKDFVITKSN